MSEAGAISTLLGTLALIGYLVARHGAGHTIDGLSDIRSWTIGASSSIEVVAGGDITGGADVLVCLTLKAVGIRAGLTHSSDGVRLVTLGGTAGLALGLVVEEASLTEGAGDGVRAGLAVLKAG